jgi:hypothetical protein
METIFLTDGRILTNSRTVLAKACRPGTGAQEAFDRVSLPVPFPLRRVLRSRLRMRASPRSRPLVQELRFASEVAFVSARSAWLGRISVERRRQ